MTDMRMHIATVPALFTERLVLRPHREDDFPAYAAFLASKRAIFMGGPHQREKAWAWFCNDIAHWQLFGFGGLMIEMGGKAVGQVMVAKGRDLPEPELGWLLYRGYEGQGIAYEAASALKTWARGRVKSLVSYVDCENIRSCDLAARLGGEIDPEARTPNDDPCLVFRYEVSA